MSNPPMYKIVENYILYDPIGAGQYGKVFRAKNTKTNETVAVKTIPLQKFAQVPKLEEFTSNEIKTLARINNVNVVRFIEMLKTVNNLYQVYEFCEGGTLEDLIRKRKFLPEREALDIFLQLLNGFKAIYKENILHRDLKPSNILAHNGVFKIADFGFCKKVSGPQELTFTMVGSPIYMAPEILKGFPYNIKGDIWSLGVCLYEMLFGVCPFEDKTLAGLIYQIDKKPLIFPRKINNISQATETLLRRMLVLDHRNRISWDELLQYQVTLVGEEKIPKSLGTAGNTGSTGNTGNTGNPVAVPTPTVEVAQPKPVKAEPIVEKIEKIEKPVQVVENYVEPKPKAEVPENIEEVDNKVDFEDHEQFNEKLQQQKAVAEEKVMRALMKERNKIVFLMNLVRTALEHNIGNKVGVVVYLALKKAYILIESLRREISIENANSKFKVFENWEEFQATEEFLTFSRYVNEEIEEIVVFTALVKREIETMLQAMSDDHSTSQELLRNPVFETELLSNGNLNEYFFYKALVSYAEEVKSKGLEKSANREEGYAEIMRHANEVLDCLHMDELFEKTLIDSGLRLEEQRYFAYVRTCEKEKLQNMVNEKLDLAKTRVA